MSQDWSGFPVVGEAPRAQPSAPRTPAPPAYIPPTPNPAKQAEEARKQAAEQRAQEDQALQRQKFELDQQQAQRSAKKDATGSVEQTKSAGFAKRAIQANTDYSKLGNIGPTSYLEKKVGDNFPDAANYARSPQRQQAIQAEEAFIAAVLRYDSGAAIPPEEFVTQGRIYFPRPGDSPEVIAQKAEARRVAIEGLKTSAGPAGEGIEIPDFGAFAAPPAGTTNSPPPDGPRNDGPNLPPAADGSYPTPQSHPDGYVGIDPVTGDEVIVGWTPQTIARYKEIERINNQRNFMAGAVDGMSGNAMIERAKYGALLGFGDEVSGFGGALAGVLTGKDPVEQYNLYRDADLVRQRQFQEKQGLTGSVAEFLGAGATTLAIPGATSGTIRGAAKAGGITGGIQGAGDARTYRDVVPNAMIGAAGGAVLGGGLQGGFNAAAPLVRRAAGRTAQPIANADEVVAAGQAEGIDVNRAMIDPALENRVTGVDASMAGGPRFQRGIGEIEGQFENRVQALGQGGTPMNRQTTGEMARGAGERFIQTSGKRAKAQYDAAEKLAGDAKVTPQQSLAAVDDAIARLSETPGTNAAEINFLQTLKSDLSKDLSVGGLRRMRTSLRQRISKGELTFGEDEATILGIMDTAAQDIKAGLIQQGKGNAAKAFEQADAAYRERMDYITGTLQKIIGKRNANLPAETIADRLSAMARGKDEMGIKRFMDTLDPTERADVSATFADALGRNRKGEFSVAHFLDQTTDKTFPEGALRVVFGDEGAASIKRLRTIAPELKRVTSAMNSRKSGTSVGNDYRSWLFNLVAGAVPGGLGGNLTGALMGAAATVGVKAGRDVLGARALLSKDISKWLVNTPRTTNPKAIDKHFSQLSAIAGGTSPYRMEAQQLLEYLQTNARQAANTSAAAASSEENK